MPRAHPPESRRPAIGLDRLREKPIAQIASDLGIAEPGGLIFTNKVGTPIR